MAEGHEFIVMNLLGPSLKHIQRRLKKKQMKVKTAVQIGIELVERLMALHEVGFLHLDLKPDNILLG
jgi:serine/threonine protein kinase